MKTAPPDRDAHLTLAGEVEVKPPMPAVLGG